MASRRPPPPTKQVILILPRHRQRNVQSSRRTIRRAWWKPSRPSLTSPSRPRTCQPKRSPPPRKEVQPRHPHVPVVPNHFRENPPLSPSPVRPQPTKRPSHLEPGLPVPDDCAANDPIRKRRKQLLIPTLKGG